MNKNETSRPALDDQARYAAFRARDSRFDGRFFIGISSTGIYCRPVCRVRLPKEENCNYYVSAAAAEAAGYRPCLRCRPELAPGHSQMEALSRTARRASLVMEEEWLADHSLSELAEKLGITDRHLRRSFAAEYGVSPVRFLQTRRLLLAKNLLTDTNLPVTEVAMATGFGSIRRFNDLFKKHYRLTPSAFRKQKDGADPDRAGETELVLNLGYRPPYAWEQLLRFLAAQAAPGVEEVADGSYRRAVALSGGGKTHVGWIRVENRPKKNALALTLAPSLLPVLPKLLSRVRAFFDLNSSPLDIHEQLRGLDELAPGLNAPGARLPGCFEIFETAAAALLRRWSRPEDKAARARLGRLAELFGQPVHTPYPALRFAFPDPPALLTAGRKETGGSAGLNKADGQAGLNETDGQAGLNETGAPAGLNGAGGQAALAAALAAGAPDRLPEADALAEAEALLRLAEALRDNSVDLAPGADPATALQQLLALPGSPLGAWPAQYLVMRALGWTDAFPGALPEDLVEAFPAPPSAETRRVRDSLAGAAFRASARAWRPWRAYASMNLWDFFSTGRQPEQTEDGRA